MSLEELPKFEAKTLCIKYNYDTSWKLCVNKANVLNVC